MTQTQSPAAIAEAEAAIRNKFLEIVAALGDDGSDVALDEILPASGLIDSAGLLELIGWYEGHFGFILKQDQITIDNLGSIAQMARFALSLRATA